MKRIFSCVLALGLLGCIGSGPSKTLGELADALVKKDSGAFLARIDMERYAANSISGVTKNDKALNALDSLGKMFGVGGISDLVGSLAGVIDVQKEMTDGFIKGVSTGELQLACKKSEKADCPYVAESLKAAQVKEIGANAAIARITTPTGISSWLALAKKGDLWLVVGLADTEANATLYANEALKPKTAPTTPQADEKSQVKSI